MFWLSWAERWRWAADVAGGAASRPMPEIGPVGRPRACASAAVKSAVPGRDISSAHNLTAATFNPRISHTVRKR